MSAVVHSRRSLQGPSAARKLIELPPLCLILQRVVCTCTPITRPVHSSFGFNHSRETVIRVVRLSATSSGFIVVPRSLPRHRFSVRLTRRHEHHPYTPPTHHHSPELPGNRYALITRDRVQQRRRGNRVEGGGGRPFYGKYRRCVSVVFRARRRRDHSPRATDDMFFR